MLLWKQEGTMLIAVHCDSIEAQLWDVFLTRVLNHGSAPEEVWTAAAESEPIVEVEQLLLIATPSARLSPEQATEFGYLFSENPRVALCVELDARRSNWVKTSCPVFSGHEIPLALAHLRASREQTRAAVVAIRTLRQWAGTTRSGEIPAARDAQSPGEQTDLVRSRGTRSKDSDVG